MTDLIQRWPQISPKVLSLAKHTPVTSNPLQILCPLDKPQKILCIGLNYRDHALETGQPIPEEPIVFCKMAPAMIGPDEPIVLPRVSTSVDYEAELVVVIGGRVRHADETTARNAIFGYSVGHDVSARDWQTGKPGRQWFLGKSFDTFAPLGPSITTSDSISDAMNLKIQSRINGETMQNGSTKEMIFSPVALIMYLSQVMTLDVGDVIFTGTPPGVGTARKPQRFLKDGDIVEIEIEGLGVLRNPCAAESM
jgi:2-keto-4-pentenoate hydratase/2-oxohepta-3-ene-1,7-dioic acid hydratase in catechol pathway